MKASVRRKKRQAGQEIIEFALVSIFLIPMLLGSFVVGINIIKNIQANQVVRDLDNIYIHGGDFSTYPLQQLAQRLAQGLNLQFPAFSNGNQQHSGKYRLLRRRHHLGEPGNVYRRDYRSKLCICRRGQLHQP